MSEHDRERWDLADPKMAERVAKMLDDLADAHLDLDSARFDAALRVLGPAVKTTTGTVGADEWTERDVDRLAALIRGSSYDPGTVTLADGARDAAVYLLGKGVVMPEEPR